VPPGLWPPAGYAPAPGGVAVAGEPAHETPALGGSGLSRLLMSLESLESSSFQALHARWPAVQQAVASAGSTRAQWRREGEGTQVLELVAAVFNGVCSSFGGWQDQHVIEVLDSFRARYRPARWRGWSTAVGWAPGPV